MGFKGAVSTQKAIPGFEGKYVHNFLGFSKVVTVANKYLLGEIIAPERLFREP